MAALKEARLYNMKVVVRETGLTPDVLRVWERRYGVPRPSRTSGGHRLYSQQDIEMLKWLAGRKREGLSISHAIQLWNQMTGIARSAGTGDPETPDGFPLESRAPDALREAWVERCLAFDERGAEAVVSAALGRYPADVVAVDVLEHGVADIDELWYRSEASAQQIAFGAGLASRHVDALLQDTPPAARPGRILLACPPEEQHTLGLQVLALLLRRQGWDVVYLGPNLPFELLDRTLDDTDPRLVLLSAQQLVTGATLADMSLVIHAAGRHVAYGGRIFNLAPRIRSRVAGHFLGERLAGVPLVIGEVLNATVLPDRPPPIDERLQRAAGDFRQRQPLIDADIRRVRLDLSENYLMTATAFLNKNLAAALTLGDLSLLDEEIDWLRTFLDRRDIPLDTLTRFLVAYDRSAHDRLGPDAGPIFDWLAAQIAADR